MSLFYKQSKDIPNEVLAERLNELSKAVVARMDGRESTFSNEFTCRIPVELDRDADVVLMEASLRLKNSSNSKLLCRVNIELTPEKQAEFFWDMSSDEQAKFFNHLSKISDDHMCSQLQYICESDDLTIHGRDLMELIGEYAKP